MSGNPKGRPSKKQLISKICKRLKRVNPRMYEQFQKLPKRHFSYESLENIYKYPHPSERLFFVAADVSREEKLDILEREISMI